jgi:predicted metal-dependent phosphoesterase TrpH
MSGMNQNATVPPPSRFGQADLQVHTAYGDGMDDARELFRIIEETTDLDVVAVTDHDDIGGALLAREVHARGSYHFDLVTGIEVTTRSGHLLALWVDEPVPSLRPLDETIATIHGLGGLAVIPHPLSPMTRSVGQRTLERLLAHASEVQRPDGIEVSNSSMAGLATGRKALRLNRERWHLAETGGSDAHFAEAVGRAYTRFPGVTADAVRAAIQEHRTEGILVGSTPYREIGVRKLAYQQVRGLSVTPRKVLGPRIGTLIERARAGTHR